MRGIWLVATAVFALFISGCGETDRQAWEDALADFAKTEKNLRYGTKFSEEAPSDVFCGKALRNGPCANHELVDNPTISPHLVEVRGWVLDQPYPTDGRAGDPEEYAYSVLLDHDWLPDPMLPSHVIPIYTPGRVNRLLSPYNVLAFGRDTAMDSDGQFFGGGHAAVVHVEVNGFDHASRGAGRQDFPQGWNILPWGHGTALWSWPPTTGLDYMTFQFRELAVGDYIRIVGLAWEDEAHIRDWCLNMLGPNCGQVQDKQIDYTSGEEGYDDAEDCWDDGASRGHGWTEIHPPDLVAILPPKPMPGNKDLGVLVTACDEHFDAGIQFDVFPATEFGVGGQTLQCGVDRNLMFTNLESISLEQSWRIAEPRNGCRFRVDLDDTGSVDAKYQAWFSASWE